MKYHRFQNKVARSVFTLPVCIVVAAAMWWLPERAFSLDRLWGLLLCLLTTYVVMETNAQQHIIRIRTRMMSCVWLVLTACLPFMHPLGKPLVAAALLSVSYMLLFRCYQRHHPQTIVFHAFLMLGIGSFFAPVMLLMAVPYFLYIAIFLRSLTRKAFWAGVLGLVVPFWCYCVWCLVTDGMQSLIDHIPSAIYHLPSTIALLSPEFWEEHFSPLIGEGSEARLFSASLIFLFSIVSIVHYLRTNYDDKIRVRMILYIYMSQTIMMMIFLLLQPEHYETALALLVASASPLIAHYFSLGSSILSNIFFVLSLLLTAGMAAINLFLPLTF